MCDHTEGNWVWTVRERRTGEPVTSKEGFKYYFAEENEAEALVSRLNRTDLELVRVREPGA